MSPGAAPAGQWMILGECTIAATNEVDCKFQCKGSSVILAKRGSLLRFHQVRPSREEDVVVLEALDSKGNSFQPGNLYFTIDRDTGLLELTSEVSDVAVFKVVKAQFMKSSTSLQVLRRSSRDKEDLKDLWLRHSSWKVRADADSGQSYILDASFHFEEPKTGKTPLMSSALPEPKRDLLTVKKKSISKDSTREEEPEKRKAGRPAKAKALLQPPAVQEDEERPVKRHALERERDDLKMELDKMKTSYDEKRARYMAIKQQLLELSGSSNGAQ